ncbi:hypothetical protein B0T17DRAFT_603011, partial [Bombardia bombarda]
QHSRPDWPRRHLLPAISTRGQIGLAATFYQPSALAARLASPPLCATPPFARTGCLIYLRRYNHNPPATVVKLPVLYLLIDISGELFLSARLRR